MANFIDVENLNYCGKEAQDIFAKDTYDIDLRQYGITFLDGLKGKQKIYSGELSDVYQLYSCPFSPAGKASLDEAYIEPAAIKVNLENCFDTFWPTYMVEQTSITLNGGIPQSFADWFFAQLRAKMSKEYQEIFWAGDTGYTGNKGYLKATDGIEKQLNGTAAAATVTKFSVDNILGQVEAAIMKAIEVADEAEVDTEGYKVFMNHSDVRVLEVALGKLCCGNSTSDKFSNYARENGRIYVMGYEVVPTLQTKNSIIVGPARNLVLGFDTYDSHLQYKLIDMRETTGDNMFRVIALTNIAAGVIMPSLFVYGKA